MRETLIGKRFGKLVVLRQLDERSEHGHIQFLCKCDCGNEVIKLGVRLRANKARSCGCVKETNLIGECFGRLTVIDHGKNNNRNEKQWKCLCECGNIVFTTTSRLRSGSVQSCGCLRSELVSKRNHEGKKYTMLNTRVYEIWRHMKERCYKKYCKEYYRYGGRGIEVCEEWLHDFQAFYDWSMANGYADDLTIDREDVNGNYEPGNCRWATQKEQSNNKRNNHFLTYKGETKTISQWSDEFDMPDYLIRNRLKAGMPMDKVFYKGDLRCIK